MSAGDARRVWEASAGQYDQAAETFEPFAEWLAELCLLHEGMDVLDVGCGTGISALVAARHVGSGGRVVGLDASRRMIEVAREKALATGCLHLRFMVCAAENICLPDDSFDAVICNFSLHLFGDEPGALREMTRVAKPAGKVAWTVPAPDHAQEMIAAYASVCQELQVAPLPGQRPLKPDLVRINQLLRSCRIPNPEIRERKQVFSYVSPESFEGVLRARMGRLLSRAPEERRAEIAQRMLAILLRDRGKLTFTCHAYGVVHGKPLNG